MNCLCLLSRITTSTSSPFGMTFPETSSINSNVRNNNNIVWKNIGVYDLSPGTMAPAQAVVGNMTNVRMNAKFRFELLNQEGNRGLFDKGRIMVTPVGKLAEFFQQNPPRGDGIELREDGTIDVLKQNATIEGVKLGPKEFGLLNMKYVPNDLKEMGQGFAINFTQLATTGTKEEIIGGQTFVYGKVAGFLTQPDGIKGGFHCSLWCWMGILLIIITILIIWWRLRKK